MSAAATVIKPSGTPEMAVVCMSIAVVQILSIVAFAFAGQWSVATFSLAVAFVFLVGAYFYMGRAKQFSVTITQTELIIADRATTKVTSRSDIESIHLNRGHRQVKLKNGRWLHLPLEGQPLLHAAIILQPQASLVESSN